MAQIPFKYLTAAEMLSLSKTLCEDEQAKVAAIPLAAPVLPVLAAAHARLLEAKPVPTTVGADPVLGEISRDEKARDLRHDHYVTALHLLFQANIELAAAEDPPDDARASALTSLARALLPDGLHGAVHASYAGEAGNAEVLEKAFHEPGNAKLLGELAFRDGVSAASVAAAHVANAREIGKLEELRRVPAERAELNGARRDWTSAARLLEMALGQAGTPDALALRAPLVKKAEDARARALGEQRRRAKETKDGAQPAPALVTSLADGDKK